MSDNRARYPIAVMCRILGAQLDEVRADRDAWRDQAHATQRLLAPPDRRPGWRRIVG